MTVTTDDGDRVEVYAKVADGTDLYELADAATLHLAEALLLFDRWVDPPFAAASAQATEH